MIEKAKSYGASLDGDIVENDLYQVNLINIY
jgi:hypothetical protein